MYSRCAHSLNNEWSSHSWTFLMCYNMLIHFSLSNFVSPLHVAQHHQKWFMMALIHEPSSEQRFFLAAFNKCFLMFLAKCHTSNWCRISFHFFLKRILLAYACLLLEKKYWWHCHKTFKEHSLSHLIPFLRNYQLHQHGKHAYP